MSNDTLTWRDGTPCMTRMRGTADDYRVAPSGEGPQASEWLNKPHRLVYDLAGEVKHLHAALAVETARADREGTARREAERQCRVLSLAIPLEDELSPRIDELLWDIAVQQWQAVAVASLLKDCQRRMADDWTTIGNERRQRMRAEAERDRLRAVHAALRGTP